MWKPHKHQAWAIFQVAWWTSWLELCTETRVMGLNPRVSWVRDCDNPLRIEYLPQFKFQILAFVSSGALYNGLIKWTVSDWLVSLVVRVLHKFVWILVKSKFVCGISFPSCLNCMRTAMVDFHLMNLSPSVKICEIWNLLKVSDIDKQFKQNIKFS